MRPTCDPLIKLCGNLCEAARGSLALCMKAGKVLGRFTAAIFLSDLFLFFLFFFSVHYWRFHEMISLQMC